MLLSCSTAGLYESANTAQRNAAVRAQTIRRYDSNHLLFGMRGGCFGFLPLLKLFAQYVDVYDLHKYNDQLGQRSLLEEYALVHNTTGLPIIHGEFSYTAIDSGLPNLRGARPSFPPSTRSPLIYCMVLLLAV